MTGLRHDAINVLLVDDDPGVLLSLEAALERLGERLIFARSGRDALRVLLEHDVAVIVLDVRMAGLDGFETARSIRERERTRDTPIIFLTGLDLATADIMRAYSASGAVDFLMKPVVPEVLAAKVSVFAELFRKSMALREQSELLLESQRREQQRAVLEARAEELARSNTELDQFAHVVSHDLRAPLTTMVRDLTGVADDSSVPEAARERVRHCVHKARRLESMVTSLLEWARVDTRTAKFESVDLSTVVSAVLDDLRADIDDAGARVELGTLPRVEGDAIQLARVLSNLITNALRFHHDGRTPELRIDAVRGEDRWQIDVSDNGIGIAPGAETAVFQVYRRASNDARGTGMGLAIAKRIVERHGGRIWIARTSEAGTTVSFTLPARPETAPTPDRGAGSTAAV